MMNVSTYFRQHVSSQDLGQIAQAGQELDVASKEQLNQKPLSPALSCFVLLVASIAVWGAIGLVTSDMAQAQVRPYPPRTGGYGQGPGGNGESIAELQRHLADLGYFNGEITGSYGPQTQEAIVRFQQDMGLAADGIVGPETARALFQGSPGDEFGAGEPSYEEAAGDARIGVGIDDSGDQVAELQQRLADLGYYSGEISGVFDYPTEAAVMQFQRDNGLETDGVVGPNTEDTLRRPSEEIMRPAEVPTSEAEPTETELTDPQASNFGSSSQSGNLLRVGDSGQSVNELQTRLQELGLYQGALTGIYDPETEAAVIVFQQSQGLTVDGVVGPQVNSALYNPALAVANSAIPANSATPANVATTDSSTPSSTIPGSSVPTATVPDATTTVMPQPSIQPALDVEQARLEAEQARLAAEQVQLEAEQTRAMLNQNFSEGRYSVAELQRRLRNEGIYPGEVNGVLDSETQSAIVAAQRKHGLSQSDLYGSSNTSVAPSF